MTEVLDQLYSRERSLVVLDERGLELPDFAPSQSVVLAGSFNPLHRGHRKMLAAAEKISNRTGIYEISVENVDKPDLPRDELEKRLEQFRGNARVAITRARLFSDKAALLPGAWFVIGFDTAVRLLDDSYYEDNDATGDLLRLQAAGLKFLVAGRVDNAGRFRDISDLRVPESLTDMFIAVPESVFREDVSSTELRAERSR